MKMIDNIVTASSGAYTHDDVFKLDANFAYGISLLHYEEQGYRSRVNSIREQFRNK